MMPMWDLTQTVSPHMVMYPGQPAPQIHHFAEAARDGYGMSEYRFWNHLGTHIDGPLHFFAGKPSLHEYPLDRLIVPARVVHVSRSDGPEVSVEQLVAQLGQGFTGQAVVLDTGTCQRWGTEAYYEDFPVLSEAAARWLVAHEVGMLALDTPSADPVATESFPLHRILLGGDCLIIENLAYDPTLPDAFRLVALPMKVEGSNGDPARVVGLPL